MMQYPGVYPGISRCTLICMIFRSSRKLPGSGRSRVSLLALLLAWLAIAPAFAHKVSSVSLLAKINTKDRTYEIGAAMEVAPSEDPTLNDQISPEEAARTFAEDYLNILFDEEELHPELKIATVTASDEDTPEALQRKQVEVQLNGAIPEGAKDFLLYIDPDCPMAVIMVVIKDEKPARRMQVVLSGEYSRPVNVEPVVEGDPFKATGEKGENQPAVAVEKETPEPQDAKEKAPGEKAGNGKGPCPFCAGWQAVVSDIFLHGAIIVSILLITLSILPVTRRLGALLAGQCLGLSLLAFLLVPDFSFSLSLVAAGLVVCSVLALIDSRFYVARVVLLVILGFFQGNVFGQSVPFRSFAASVEHWTAGNVILFQLGAIAVQVAIAVPCAVLLLILSRQPWYRKWVAHPFAILLAGYGLFVLVDVFF